MDFTNNLLIDSIILLIILTLVFQTNRLKKISKKQSEIQKQQAKIQDREGKSCRDLDECKLKIRKLIKHQCLMHGLNRYCLSCVGLDKNDNNNRQCQYLIRHTDVDENLTYPVAIITITNNRLNNVKFIASNDTDVSFEMQKWINDNAYAIVMATDYLYF